MTALIEDESPVLQYDGLEEVIHDIIDAPIDTAPCSLTGGAHKRCMAKPKKSDDNKKKTEKVLMYEHLAGLLATNLLAADDEIEMIDNDDNVNIGSDVLLADYQWCLRKLKDTAVNIGGVTLVSQIVGIGQVGPVLHKPKEVTLDALVKQI